MPWTKIDDQFYDHPKVVAAGPLGVALFVCSLSYCARHLTDGFITATQAKRLIDVEDPLEVAEQLVAVGLWERRDGGYQVHDYLEYNPSAAQVKAQRAANAERQAKWRGKQPQVTETGSGDGGNSNGVNNAVSNNAPSPMPLPSPMPIPEPAEKKLPQTAAAQAPAPTPPAATPRTSSRKKKPRTPVPPAVKVFRENAHYYPAKSWYDDVAEAVGDDPSNLELWGKVVKGYVGQGWNPTNVSNMLEFYQRKEIPGDKHRSDGKDPPHAGILEWMESQGVTLEAL